MARKCSGHTGDQPCKAWSIKGGTVCIAHGGKAPQVRAKAAIRVELSSWGLGEAHSDPGEVLLRLVTQSARRVQEYSAAIAEAVEEYGLEDALIGDAKVYNPSTKTIEKVGEYIRGLTQLEFQERDRCAGFAAKAVAAGLDKRRVELAERQGALIGELLRAVLNDPALGLTAAQRRAVPDVTRAHLSLVAGL